MLLFKNVFILDFALVFESFITFTTSVYSLFIFKLIYLYVKICSRLAFTKLLHIVLAVRKTAYCTSIKLLSDPFQVNLIKVLILKYF
jgi:hypothetical protein